MTLSAEQIHELQFVGRFWWLANHDAVKAERIAAGLPPEAVTHEVLAAMYRLIADRVGSGEGVGLRDAELSYALGQVDGDFAETLWEEAYTSGAFDIVPLVKQLHTRLLARRQADLYADIAAKVRQLAEKSPTEALRSGEAGALKLLAMHAETTVHATPQTRDEIADAELSSMEAGGIKGVTWPYPKMQRLLGPILPGRVYGFTAYPNCGKSTFLANLFRLFCRRMIPCIVAPTEMRTDWLRRAWAADARVPQEIAENQLWSADDPEVMEYLRDLWCCGPVEVRQTLQAYRQQYGQTVELFRNLPWEVINRADLSPDEAIRRFSILRRRYPGQHVVGMIDHAHNMKYPADETDKYVGAGVRRMRDFCQDDGLFSLIVLFQPKKAVHPHDLLKPIRANEIRGQVAQILDVHVSIYRRQVRAHPFERTPWGTPACERHASGGPVWAKKPDEEGAKLDDEHFHFKPDKRRIGGEGPSFYLNAEAPTGHVYEESFRRDHADRGAA